MRYLIFFTITLLVSCSSSNNLGKNLNFRNLKYAPLGKGESKEMHESFGKKYMVTTQGRETSKAAINMFKKGGNAIDAAIAASFSISVERPHSTGLGGGGFMLIHIKGMDKPLAIDFREKAPLNAYEKMYLDKDGKEIKGKSLNGIFSVGVPGLVAGLYEVHQKYGKLPWKVVLQDAIKLARDGFSIYPELAKALSYRSKTLAKYPATKKIFFGNDGAPLKAGDRLVQKDLSRTLEIIASKGVKGFYKGEVANKIIKEVKRLGGLITQKDLDIYNAKWRDPVKGEYKGNSIYSMSPPSSGGIHVIQILNILENDNLKKFGPQHEKSIHLTASAMQAAFADRAKYLGDDDFVTVPVKGLTSKEYASAIRFRIPEGRALISKDIHAGKPFKYESPETTHFTIMDSDGNTVSTTQTINYYFGSGVVVPETGIILNDEMDDFSIKSGAKNIYGAIGGKQNLISPEKRPLSSMSPTIVYKGGKPILALGTPNGTRILTCVALTLLNYLEYEMPLYESITAIRYHHQWNPDEIWMEKPGIVNRTIKRLFDMRQGVKINEKIGCRVQAIAFEDGSLHGVSDPRGFGLATGL
jgi:gamma-glutamyltranspeptidase/glutathione hydrolase